MISKQSVIVAKWEFLRFFKWKQQLISYLLMMAVMAAVALWSYFTDESRKVYRIAVPAEFSISNSEQFQFQRPTIDFEAQLAQLQADERWHAVVTVNTTDTAAHKVELHTLAAKKWQQQLETELSNYFRQQYATELQLTPAQLEMLQQPVSVEYTYLDENFKGKDTPEKMIALGVLILLFIGLSTAFGQVLLSITGEKQQRVTEQLYAIVTPQQWMDGKVLGHSLSAMKAMVTSALVMLLVFIVVSVVVRDDGINLSWLNWAVLAWLVPFALLGVLLSACFMGAIAASIDDPNTSGKGAVMMITWLPMLFTYLVIDSPTGSAMTILSWLPLTSFAAMPVKMAMVDLPWWQPALSLLLLVAAVGWMRRVAGRIFLRGMQMYGKEPSWGQIVGWALSNKTD
ncbi:MAG: sodium ABC transporter permease [Rheinheimera sp.]|uniref:ABC transporter permease n=1 Tax=Arsukibacterium sp. UBA3155 TaxID=1946058 RepID=UPI000C97FE0E|nr:ABC transporter permease [Arsukibacterium sp. UBA3155]MAD75563.1 sodium ABC transporter permease [Rheinheimera sp.]|tara:strand:+ start:20532 stop:21728 length:1197 start_codon:yes stop_codon:yes gene_type:complete